MVGGDCPIFWLLAQMLSLICQGIQYWRRPLPIRLSATLFLRPSYELTVVFFFNFDFFLEREGKGGRMRGRETSMWERNIHQLPLVSALTGTESATQACALTGIQLAPFCFWADTQPSKSHHSGWGGRFWIMRCCVVYGVILPKDTTNHWYSLSIPYYCRMLQVFQLKA